MRYQSSVLFVLAASALADNIGGTDSVSNIIAWSPKTPSSMDQSVIYHGTYYLADRTNAGVHIVKPKHQPNTQTALITGFMYVRWRRGRHYQRLRYSTCIFVYASDAAFAEPTTNERSPAPL
ncbi:hypothetical protein NA56DRAFT_705031 [Hyaloscypha hepaticicola]|uniref:Glycoside hydrolase family 43 protein n=1 Tax=Hyaloscypha hepaticicola TaxID=2082293 RepID=A0A2J6Q0H9_9HELO|nr:hypothetical protein NA56DRAFT_705031 [Hyaloscypha hepaticicola]